MTATISGSATSTLVALTTTGNTILGDASTDTLNVGNGDLVKDASGNVGIGTSSPSTKLHLYGATDQRIRFENTGWTKAYQIGNDQNALSFYDVTAAAERARIDSSGNLLVGNTGGVSSGGRVQVLGAATTSAANIQVGTNGYPAINFNNTSGIQQGYIVTNASTVGYVSVSDYRLKENVQPMAGALDKVALLKPVTYKWKVDGSDGQGFIAHELAQVVPDCVSGEKDATREEQYEITPAVKDEDGNVITEAVMGTRTVPDYQGIDTSFLVATLTAAIQEQQALITSLTTRLTALENK
jgi:hypothetical protein